MNFSLTHEQKSNRKSFRLFSEQEVAPHATAHDREQRIPDSLIRRTAELGYLGSFLPKLWGGLGLDMISYGLLHEEIGKACSSLRSLLTVHDMVMLALLKWGSDAQRQQWLQRLVRGEVIGAFAVTEPGAGSDANAVESIAVYSDGVYCLNGVKKWITFGQIADLFLVLAKCEGRATAFLVERSTPGLSVRPIENMLGMRGAMLAELTFANCVVPEANLIGRQGFGLTSIAFTALGLGRYTVAWGSVGIAQACLEASMKYANERKQFKVRLRDHQLIQQMISDMIVNVAAARLMCCRTGYLKDNADPGEIMETFTSKYFASTVAMKAATDAVQIHGANGCSSSYPVERYLRDAKIMEIIEGSSQIQQMMIAKFGYQEVERQMLEEQNLAQATAMTA